MSGAVVAASQASQPRPTDAGAISFSIHLLGIIKAMQKDVLTMPFPRSQLLCLPCTIWHLQSSVRLVVGAMLHACAGHQQCSQCQHAVGGTR